MQPKVTFIIAHHNYQEYLEGCIKSAINQTHPNIHICIIDDCSEDQKSVKEIFESFLGQETYFIEHQENQTVYSSSIITYIELKKEKGSYKQAYARNRGIEACWNSDYFAILDADDENYPTKIEKCVKILEENKEVGAVYTDTDIIKEDRLVREYREPYDYFRLVQECIVHSGCVIRKSALEDVLENGKVFDEDVPPVEDYDLWLRIGEKYLFYHIPESLVLVRVHPQNSTNTSTHEHRMNKLKTIFQKRQERHG